MDRLDQKILQYLQTDASLPVAEIAERVGLSPTPCWRRIQNLEKAGVIKGRVALLDPEKLNVGVTVFVRLSCCRPVASSWKALTCSAPLTLAIIAPPSSVSIRYTR